MSKRLNLDEAIAKQWLENQGHCVGCPCGDPPDLVADGRYAVEVRRLNRQVRSQGEEEYERPLGDLIKDAIRCMRPTEGTWIVDAEYQYSEGYPDTRKARREAKREIQEALCSLTERDDGVLDAPRSRYLNRCGEHSRELDHIGGLHLCLPCGIHLELHRIESSTRKFRLGNVSEGEGVLVEPTLQESIEFAIEEKAGKIKGKEQDHEWWLVLVDYIGVVPSSGLSKAELASLRRRVRVVAPWSRVVIVSRRNPEWWYELCPDEQVPCGKL